MPNGDALFGVLCSGAVYAACVSLRLPVTLLLAFPACSPPFSGDQGHVFFDSTLQREFLPWAPSYAVMPGTDLRIDAVTRPFWVQGDHTPPHVVPRFSGTGLAVIDAGRNWCSVAATSPGETSIDWVGSMLADGGFAASDHFSVRVAEPDAFALSDPFLFYRAIYPDGLFPDAGAWPDVDAGFTMAGGGRLYLELLPYAAGSLLFYSPGVVSASVTAPFSVEACATGVFVSSPIGGLPARGTVTLSVDSGFSARFDVAATDEVAVARVDLVTIGGNGTWVLKATARTLDGGVWWDAPLVWSWPAPLTSIDAGSPALFRREVRVLATTACDVNDSGVLFDVTAAVRGISATSRIALPPCRPAFDAPPPPPPRPACGCASAGSSLAVLLALCCARRQATAQTPARSFNGAALSGSADRQ